MMLAFQMNGEQLPLLNGSSNARPDEYDDMLRLVGGGNAVAL